MNIRERFLATLDFEPVAPPKWEFGYWGGTIRRWYGEGLVRRAGIPDDCLDGATVQGGGAAWWPGRVPDFDVEQTLQLDPGMWRIPLNNYICPVFEEEVLEEGDGWVQVRDDMGMIVQRRGDRQTLPHYIRGPVETRDDWERLKAERLRPTLEGRLPANWPAYLERFQERTFPLAIAGMHGFFGTPRYLLGEVQVLFAYHDQPELMRTIVNDLADFWIAIYDQMLDIIDADVAMLWEDMAYKNGPLISPGMFREFMLPGYKKLTNFFRDRGIRHILVDSDGDIWKLIPLFIEGGVTGIYPFEVMAGMNVADVRRAFPRLQILGGIDKIALTRGPEGITEALADVPWMLKQGGYIPYVDHLVPPDVSWENFRTYRRRLDALIDQTEQAGAGR